MGSRPDPRAPAWDAVMECRHGRVPFDPSPRCGCFPVEGPPGRAGIPRPTYGPLVKRRAVALYQAGRSSREVAARLGCSPRQVLTWVRKAGVPVRGRGRPWPERRAA